MKKHPLQDIVSLQKQGIPKGVFSVCSANRFVIETTLEYAMMKGTTVLIEATCNQVNQFGGYTGMTPADFREMVFSIAEDIGLPKDKIIFGGDHLGPNPWKDQPSDQAMHNAIEMIREYAKAGFTKLHLDASMRLADDPGNENEPLNPEFVAERTALLCLEAEKVFKESPDTLQPVYVIGTDVPPPGGTQNEGKSIHVTSVQDFERTVELTKKAFFDYGLHEAWERVIAVVVQLGVEFGNEHIFEYDRNRTKELTEAIKKHPNIVFEGHSTDYQTAKALKEMVEDGIAILKVGPSLTFALREALFALSSIEKELFYDSPELCSNLVDVVEKAMLDNPKNWEKYYQGDEKENRLARRYSFLDRSRYYWNLPEVETAVNKLITNLESKEIPLTLISQFMPAQYQKIRNGLLRKDPISLIKDRIASVLDDYYFATHPEYSC